MQEQFRNQVLVLNPMPNPLMERKIRKKAVAAEAAAKVALMPVHRAAPTPKQILTVWLHSVYVAILIPSKISG